MKSINKSDPAAVAQVLRPRRLRHSQMRCTQNDLLLRRMAITSAQATARQLSTISCLISSPRLRFQDDRSCPLSGSHDVMRLGAVSQVQDR